MFAGIDDLEGGLDNIQASPKNEGMVELIVCRPADDERKELDIGELDVELGLLGDNWLSRGHRKTKDGSGHPDMQINIMNSRCISLIANNKERWRLAGDQFFVDFDLSKENIPAGTVLEIGTAQIEITNEPHLGCKKFLERFGKSAVLFVNSDIGKAMNLRGVNAKVLIGGIVKVGDTIKKAA